MAAELYRYRTPDGRLIFSNTPPPPSVGAELTASPEKEATAQKGRLRRRLSEQPSDGLIASCLEKWSTFLKDLRSPYVVSSFIDQVQNLERPDRQPWKEVVIDIRAKNSFGAYGPLVIVCGIADDGTADEQTTKTYHAFHTLGITLDELDDTYVK